MRRLIDDPGTATLDLTLEQPMLLEKVRLFIRETLLGDVYPEWLIPEIQIFQSPPDEMP